MFEIQSKMQFRFCVGFDLLLHSAEFQTEPIDVGTFSFEDLLRPGKPFKK